MSGNVMALSFDCPISPEIEFHGEPDSVMPYQSWGFAWYSTSDTLASLIHGGSETSRDKISQTLNDWKRFHSATFLCKFSQNDLEQTKQNSQPFSRTLGGREWVWMSLGEIPRSHRESDSVFTEAIGTSGSEEAFCSFLDKLYANGQRNLSDVPWLEMSHFFSRQKIYNKAQIYISDGQYLSIFRGIECESETFINRFLPPHRTTELVTPVLSVNIGNKIDSHRSLAIITNAPVDGGDQRKIDPGGMVVLRRSAIVWEHKISESKTFAKSSTDSFKSFANQSSVSTLYQAHQKIITNTRSVIQTADGAALSFRKLHISHKTTYRYARAVKRSTHNFRLSPVEDDIQEVESASVSFSLATTPLFYIDTFGNRSIHLTVDSPYKEFTIFSESIIKIYALPPDDLSSPLRRAQIPLLWLPWQRQMLLPYLLPPELPEAQLWELNQYAMSFVERNDYQLLETLDDINKTIYTEFQYQSGSTSLYTSPFDVYVTRKGVCQDFANLFICLVRILNIPARYRMGYIYTGGDYKNKEQSDASHAWLEVYLPYLGWRGFDPTNGCTIGQDHIRIACGRNYIDATPTSGTIYKGGGKEELLIDVKVTDGS
ncbi:MAG: class II glutamine amidotransferase [Deltaproteobacteria bacterium]|nr:class II glutamine amidotransferase [Deltaproteobacteria bacterium]